MIINSCLETAQKSRANGEFAMRESSVPVDDIAAPVLWKETINRVKTFQDNFLPFAIIHQSVHYPLHEKPKQKNLKTEPEKQNPSAGPE